MPAFRPCIGTRAQVDATPVRDGQMLVAADTGEAFVDFGGVRVREIDGYYVFEAEKRQAEYAGKKRKG